MSNLGEKERKRRKLDKTIPTPSNKIDDDLSLLILRAKNLYVKSRKEMKKGARGSAMKLIQILKLDSNNPEIERLFTKYHIYTNDMIARHESKYHVDCNCRPPLLWDAIGTQVSWPGINSSLESWIRTELALNQNPWKLIQQDVEQMIKLIPTCLDYKGSMRCRTDCTVSHLAALNTHCPKSLLHYIMKIQNVIPDQTITCMLNYKPTTILEDLKITNTPLERIS